MKNNAGKRKKDFEALASNLKMKYTPKNNTASDHLTALTTLLLSKLATPIICLALISLIVVFLIFLILKVCQSLKKISDQQ